MRMTGWWPRARPDAGTPEEQGNDPLFVRSVARAMQVLSAFHQADAPMTLTEIAAAGEMDKSAAQRFVHTLRKLGYIERDMTDRGFVPGLRLLDHSLDYLRLNPLVERATPVLQEMRRHVHERVDLSLFDDLRVVYAARNQSKRETFFAALIGHAVPTFCASGGRAILALLTDAEVDDILARSDLRPITMRTITDPEAIREKVREAREVGYACALEEVVPGEIALGVAITGPDRRPVAAIHVAGSLSEWQPEEFCQKFGPLAQSTARALSRA
ncbi:IclR family transcriptional regulator [Stappia sp.]|uniref:IclR family transcriptional regulator n=1 Tax=Stappia sp. TaxID=1870903 RepID=UPI003A99D0E8